MQWAILDKDPRTFVLAFEEGDEVLAGLKEFAEKQDLPAAEFTAIGAFRDVVLGFFDLEKKDYQRTAIEEQVEVVSLVGNVAQHEGKPKIHAHVVVAKRDGTAHGGHLLEAHVRPTLEVMLTESPRHLRRTTDPRTGLALVAPRQ